MCGILGLYEPSGISLPRERFEAALGRLRRRGPDDSGIWHDDRIRLGHRRLSIVDLSAAGHQPMSSSDRRFLIVLNGEIYNHRDLRPQLVPDGGWRGTSDTETLLEAYRKWGKECLSRINGMFAFAIWDTQERTLFLARDRMGVKPLYYSEHNGKFAFASRPGALAMLRDDGHSSSDFNLQSLRAYLELGYVPAPMSFHKDMHKFPPAHYMLISERGRSLVRYWDYRAIEVEQSWSARKEEDLADELEALIRDTVKVRLLSDVPLGAFLSGGVDSAMVVSSMAAAGVSHPKAFTIGFREKAFDEGIAAAKIANHLRVDHVRETLDVNNLLELLPMYIDEFDEPFADSSAFPTLALARLARRHVTVALSGDGADELFSGYHYYSLIEKLKGTLTWPSPVKRSLTFILSSLPWHRGKLLAGALNSSDVVNLFHYMRGLSKDHQAMLSGDLAQSLPGSASLFASHASAFPENLHGAECGMRLDMGFTLPDLFLQKVDVATMAFSLEARCPMTDYRLVEWAMRLPMEFKLRNGETKYLLKKVLRRRIPAALVYQPKRGFSVPLAQWLRGPLKTWAHELVYDDSLMDRIPFDRSNVRELHRKQLSGEREAHPLLWSVLMLLCYVKKLDEWKAQSEVRLRVVA